MDTQRLILFVVFSFSALLLWEAWQKEFRPPPPLAATTLREGGGPPTCRRRLRPRHGRPVAPGAPAAPAADKEPAAPGRTITIVDRSLPREIDTTGGTIAQVALLKHRDPGDEAKPYLALLKTPERTFVAQSGLLGDGMPNHRTAYTRGARASRARARAPIASNSSCRRSRRTATRSCRC